MRPIWVLLWKHMLVRKRRYIYTLFDYGSPIAMLVFIRFLIPAFQESLGGRFQALHNTEPLSYDKLQRKYDGGCILFTPETNLSNQLMSEVGAKLNLRRLNHLPTSDETGYFPFSNEMTLSVLEFSKYNMTSEDAIVIFEGLDSDTWPQNLTYTIRMKKDFNEKALELTDIISYLPFDVSKDFGTPYEPFIRLQWAIDTSYLRALTGTDVEQSLSLQELPFAADAKYINAQVACIMGIGLLPLVIYLTFVNLTDRLYEGKNSGIDELLKMVGVSWEALAMSHVLDTIPIMLIYAVGTTLLYKLHDYAPHTGGCYIFVAQMLHFFSVIALGFFVVYLFNITEYNQLVSGFLYLVCYLACLFAIKIKSRALNLVVVPLLPHFSFMRFWFSIADRESKGVACTMSNIWSLQEKDRITIAESYIFMLVHTFLLVMLAWYLSRVQPGPYGQALPWDFPFQKAYWSVQPAVAPAPVAKPISEADQQYFEQAPPGLHIGIQVTDVYKSFGKDAVLHGVNLAVYHGEITVLLGHNGAGKTTLINIITGLISPTSGRVLVEGKDTLLRAREVRKLIGYCPQQNIFIPELTVLQHTMLYAMLKGKSYSQSRAAAIDLFSRLQLSAKANSFTSALSGGMLRRTQLACAVIGGSRVLVLDEPTSGLDVETRRELWDLLLGLRGDRTVLLTTHFMEEADALGDRIAALHHGQVKCNASSMFLKRAIGTGYRLSLSTVGPPKEAQITSTITGIIPDATVGDKQADGVSYNLPAKDMSQFPALFSALEGARGELGIDTIGVGKSTLDEVFVKLCSDEKFAYLEDLDSKAVEPQREKVTGVNLFRRQFAALMMRQWRYILSNIIWAVLTMVLIVLYLVLATKSSNNDLDESASKDQTVALNLDLYDAQARRALVNVDNDTLRALRVGFKEAQFEEVPDITDAALRTGKQDVQDYVMGIELNDTNAKVLYSPKVNHAAPVALNALSNALAARRAGADAGRALRARSHPLQDAYLPYAEAEVKHAKAEDKIAQWAKGVVMMSMIFLTTLLTLPIEERAMGVRHSLVMAGAPRALVWGATLTAHMARALLTCVLPTVVLAALLDNDATFNQAGFLLVLFALMALGSVAFFWFMYYITVEYPNSAVVTVYVCAFIFSFITPGLETMESISFLFDMCSVLFPPHTLTVAMTRVGRVAQVNAHCNLNRKQCPALSGPGVFEAKKCCDSTPGSEPWRYWGMQDSGSAMIYFGLQIVGYCALTFLQESGMLDSCSSFRNCRRQVAPALRFDDPPARAEAEYVAKTIKMPKNQIPDAVLVHTLQKFFLVGFCKPAFFAVKGLSLSVKKGECFGLLGVNGAGKSTTFGMLTAQTRPTGGEIFANGYGSREKGYMRTFSYCPQFGGVDRFLTGRQNLALLLTIRGLQAEDVATVAAYWLQEVDLSKDADKRVSTYSGGMARRLAAAAALCQSTPTTVLDEPTAGVDPVARRRMHVALMRAKRHRSIIIASHSLDEIESLCHRIAIMSGGELRALGSAAALKTQYGHGYSVVFKLIVTMDAEGTAMLEEFKTRLHTSFDCELRDEHLGILSYHLKDSLRYSELFSQLEQLRAQFPTLLEDYTVTETTLEEVFLMLAKEARQEPTAPCEPGTPAPKPAKPAAKTKRTTV